MNLEYMETKMEMIKCGSCGEGIITGSEGASIFIGSAAKISCNKCGEELINPEPSSNRKSVTLTVMNGSVNEIKGLVFNAE